MKKLSMFLFAILLSACATLETLPPNADFGPYPTNYEQAIRDFYETKLRDADSAKFIFEKPQKAYKNHGSLNGGKIEWIGYAVNVKINEVNEDGQYRGYRSETVMMRDGKVYKEVAQYDWAEMFHWIK